LNHIAGNQPPFADSHSRPRHQASSSSWHELSGTFLRVAVLLIAAALGAWQQSTIACAFAAGAVAGVVLERVVVDLGLLKPPRR
jgi:hypothetical protein